jgi:hypothetical protein
MSQPSNMLGVVLDPLKPRISCQYLHFAQTEDIWLKSALEGKRGVLLITGRKWYLSRVEYEDDLRPAN